MGQVYAREVCSTSEGLRIGLGTKLRILIGSFDGSGFQYVPGEAGTRAETEAAVDVLQVGRDSAQADDEACRDLGVSQPCGHEVRYFHLSGAEPACGCGRFGRGQLRAALARHGSAKLAE